MTKDEPSSPGKRDSTMSSQNQLLKTKLLVPLPPRGICKRSDLVESMESGLNARERLILINAPAGFGKSTLMVEWAAQTQVKVAWLSLDDADNDIHRFVSYLVEALQVQFPDLNLVGMDLPPSLDQGQLFDILTRLINNIAAAEETVALLLDDYHVIHSQEVHAGMQFMLDNLPQNMHVIIATRHEPPIPLAQLRARRQLSEIDEQALRFTKSDTETYLNRIRGLGLSDDDLATLCRKTEGWIAGIQMAALSLSDRKDKTELIRTLSGTHHYILDYLLAEVLERQPPPLQDFMLRTSILHTLSAESCHALYGEGGLQELHTWASQEGLAGESELQLVREVLQYLDRENLFVHPLDDERRWYRYHSLFADLLKDRLKYTHPERISTYHRLAGRWYESQDLVDLAVGHILEAGDFERAAKLLAKNAVEMVFRGNLRDLTRWFEMLPEQSRSPRPWLSISHAWSSIYVGELGPVARLLREAEASLETLDEAEEIQRISGIIEALRGYLAAMRGSMPLAVEFAKEALILLPREDLPLRGFTSMFLASVLRKVGMLDSASKVYQDAIQINRRADERNLLVETLCELASLKEDQGNLHQSETLCRDALEHAEISKNDQATHLPAAGCAWRQLGELHLEWNQLDLALPAAERGLEACRRWGQAEHIMWAQLTYARCLLAQRAVEHAGEVLEHALQLAKTLSPWYVRCVEAWRVHHHLIQNQPQAAIRWLRENAPSVELELNYQNLPLYLLECQARVELLDRTPEGERGLAQLGNLKILLSRIAEVAGEAGARKYQIETAILLSIVLDAIGDQDLAHAEFARALSYAEPEGFVRSFLDRGATVHALLREAIKRETSLTYVRRLLENVETDPSEDSTGQSFTEDFPDLLSEREMQVLRLLAAHLTSRDVAEELTIATSTVRTHIKNIYRKLDVHSRREAIDRAKSIGLLS